MKISKSNFLILTIAMALGLWIIFGSILNHDQEIESYLIELSATRSFDVEIHTIGELESMRSTNITSAIKGDLGKIVFLITDGANVKANEILIKMDPTPFEEQIEELKRLIREQQGKLTIFERIMGWEKNQVEHEQKAAEIEIEGAKLEINKIVYGDGPIEDAHLKSAVHKSFAKYNELKSFANDLLDLKAQNFLNPVELKQAENKLSEEEEVYQSAKMQYDSFLHHTLPMQIKKAEIGLKRCINKYEEILKSGAFKIAKAQSQFDQSAQELTALQNQLKNSEHQMALTVIKAPTSGMVVLKEEFRNGQRRKPRVGDIVLKNQSILDLPDLGTMIVKTKVREIDLYKIKIGTPGTIEIDAYPELHFQGKILSIGVLAVSDVSKTGDEKYFDVILKLNSSDPCLRPGMTARVVLHATRVENKCSIPIQAVFEFNKNYYCFVKKQKRCVGVPVEIGYNNDQWIEVKSGLDENLPVLICMPAWSDVENAEEIIGKNK